MHLTLNGIVGIKCTHLCHACYPLPDAQKVFSSSSKCSIDWCWWLYSFQISLLLFALSMPPVPCYKVHSSDHPQILDLVISFFLPKMWSYKVLIFFLSLWINPQRARHHLSSSIAVSLRDRSGLAIGTRACLITSKKHPTRDRYIPLLEFSD